MKVKKTHVKSEKRKARIQEAAEARKRASKKSKSKSKPAIVEQNGFRFKSQAERYKDIAVDLQSLLDDAAERYGRWDAQEKQQDTAMPDSDMEDEDEDSSMLSTPMSSALAELALLNTSLPFQAMHRLMYPLTRSLPLILHNRLKIASLLVQTLTTPNRLELALCASHTLDIIPAFIQSLSPDPDFQLLDFDSILTPIVQSIVALALDPPSSQATGDRGNDLNSATEISKRAFQVLVWLFREMGGDLVNKADYAQRQEICWSWVDAGLRDQKTIVSRPKQDTPEVVETIAAAGADNEIVDDVEAEIEAVEADEASEEQMTEEPEPVSTADDAKEDIDEESEEDLEETTKTPSRVSSGATRPHLRRLLATSFAFLVRKAKPGKPLSSLVSILLSKVVPEDADSKIAESVAWILVESIKSVDQHLHSKGPAIFSACMKQAEVSKNENLIPLLEGVLTSILHYSRVGLVDDLVETILSAFVKLQSIQSQISSYQTLLLLRLVGVLAGTRKGSRISEAAKLSMLTTCRSMAQTHTETNLEPLVQTSLKVILVAPSLQSMLSQGRPLLQSLWSIHRSHPALAATLVLTLSEQKWPYFQDFMAPLVLADLPTLDQSYCTSLIARLAEHGNLPKEASWARSTTAQLEQRFAAWLVSWNNGKVTDRQTKELYDSIVLASHGAMSADAAAPYVAALEAILTSDKSTIAEAEFEETELNSAVIVTALLELLGTVKFTQPLRPNVVQQSMAKYGWHRSVTAALASLYRNGSIQDLPEASVPTLLQHVLSSDSLLRGSALQIFQSANPASLTYTKCLEAENTPLTIQSARERAMHIRKVGILLRQPDPEEDDFKVGVAYCIASLKINFKPLWSEAIQSLETATKGQKSAVEDTVWNLLLRELEKAVTGNSGLLVTDRPGAWVSGQTTEEEELPRLQRGEFRCTSNARISQRFHAYFNDFNEASGSSFSISLAQVTEDRLALSNYESQLLELCSKLSTITERHSRDLVQLFFRYFADASLDDAGAAGGRAGRLRLQAWLTAFTKFKNPRALYRSTDLYNYQLALLSHGDNALQTLALECIFTWKSPHLVAYETNLRNLLDETKFRDELLQFSLATEGGEITQARRAEVLPITVRILYGIMSSRQGRASAAHVQAGRKSAVLSALRSCSTDELNVLIDLMLGPFEDQRSGDHTKFTFSLSPSTASPARQIGFLSLLADVLKSLGSKVEHRWSDLIPVVLNLAYHAQPSTTAALDTFHGQQARRIRQLALKRLVNFFSYNPKFNFAIYLDPLLDSLVKPRLPTFAVENAQSPSALMELFTCWSQHGELLPLLVQTKPAILPAVYDCISVPNAKNPVIAAVLEIVQRTLVHSEEEEGKTINTNIIRPYLPRLLKNLAILMSKGSTTFSSRDRLALQPITLLSALAPFIEERSDASSFLPLLLDLLRRPTIAVPENIKANILTILRTIIPLCIEHQAHFSNRPNAKATFDVLAPLFATLHTRPARQAVVEALNALALLCSDIRPSAELLTELNSFSARRLEEPDFDRRLAAFSRLYATDYKTLTALQWVPVLHSLFFFLQDIEELSIRSNANACLRRFIEVAGISLDAEMRVVFTRVLFAGIRLGIKAKQELIRSEVVSVLAAAVEGMSGQAEIEELKCLLKGDSEASFFNNIFHVQVHRRIRALKRLAEEAEAGNMSGKVIFDIILPLVSHNIISADESKGLDLVNETIQCVGHLAKQLPWSMYNRLLQQYLKLALDSREGQRRFVRTAVGILRSFHFDLTNDSPSAQALLPTVSEKLLPRLMAFLEKREESEEELRVPMAEGIASVVQYLPEHDKRADVANLITALAQILRSKAQNTRDLTRITIVNIVSFLGPAYLGIAVSELRSALTRGPQLHILSFTLHALLVRVTSKADVNVDGCLDDAIAIIADDTFGQPSKDRASQEFRSKTKVREVRQYKAMDSVEILAKHVSQASISKLLGPARDVISTSESHKALRDVDDLLRHIASGLQVNPQLDVQTLLVLCQALISQNTDFLKQRKPKNKQGKQAAAEYLVRTKRQTAQSNNAYGQNAHRFVSFGLDLLNGAFRRNKFDVHDPVVIARLDPLIALVAETLYTEETHIIERGLRAVSSLIRCPLESIERAAPVLVKQMMSILEHTGSTSSELAQTAIRALANIIRDRKSLTLRDEQLTALIGIIAPDIEETEQQPAIFALLRAIISRNFVVPEIYDLMDRLAEIMVTNQSSGTREICRSIYLQFLLDYPQGKKRLAASLQFLAKNLGNYVHESGRTSVLELLNAILNKFGVDLLDQYASLFFVSLMMDIANDASSKCREMSGENLKVLFSRVSPATRQELLDMLFGWSQDAQDKRLLRTSAQVMGLSLEALKGRSDVEALAIKTLSVLSDVVEASAASIDPQQDLDSDEDPDEVINELDWQIPYQALQSLGRLFRISPSALTSTSAATWSAVRSLLVYPHLWVRNAAARLIGIPYVVSQDCSSIDDLVDVVSKTTVQLRSKHLDDSLSLQIVRNMLLVAKRFASQAIDTRNAAEEGDQEQEDGDEGEEADDAGHIGGMEPRAPASDPLHWLFVKLSHRARVAHQTRPSKYSAEAREFKWSMEPSTILRLFGGIISDPSITVAQLEGQKLQILIPIVRISDDPNGAQDPQLDELQALAREVQALLSEKLGATSVTETYSEIRRKMLMRKEERKRSAALAALNDPELGAKQRAKRTETKAKAKKRKNQAFSETKARYGMKGGAKKPRRE